VLREPERADTSIPTGEFMSGASPWSVKGISAEERDLAKQAARRAGVPIGQWLSRQICDAADHERAERGPGRGAGSWRAAEQAAHEPNPHSPTAVAWRSALAAPHPATELPYPPPVHYAPPPSAPAPAPVPTVRPAPASVDPARVRDLERRLDELPDVQGRLKALEKLEQRLVAVTAELAEVGSRLEQVEKRADGRTAALTREVSALAEQVEELQARPSEGSGGGAAAVAASTAPIERAVMRLAERLQRVEELTLPDERSDRSLLGRLFRR
jgi:hypothetical protein